MATEAPALERTPRPDHVPPALVRDFDHWNGADYLAHPVFYWDDVRPTMRVFWSPFYGGFWCLTRYDDIHEAYQRPDVFTSRITNIPGREVRLLPITLDPPDHTKYRRLLNKPFAPGQIEDLILRIDSRAQELADAITPGEPFDFIASFAKPLPTTIFCEMLGLPSAEVKKFLDWNHTILHVHGDAEGQERQRQANAELTEYLTELVGRRRVEREGDLLSGLLDAEVDGDRLADDEALAMAYLLFMAGLDTVTSALGWCWEFLAGHPEHRQQLLDDPSLMPDAIEELLRYFAFVEDSRTLTQDIEFAGVSMKAGERIMLPTSTACRDEAQFPDALTVDFHREPNRHIAFASGPHRCVGSHLARAELRIAMEVWHRQWPHYRIPEGERPTYHGGAVVGAERLPLEIITA